MNIFEEMGKAVEWFITHLEYFLPVYAIIAYIAFLVS